MSKTENELKALKNEFEELKSKLHELSDEELNHVVGGVAKDVNDLGENMTNEIHIL